MDSTDKEKGNNVIIDLIQQNLLPDNDRFYIGHNPQTNTYKIKEDPNQVEKDEIVAIIAAVDLEIWQNLKEEKLKILEKRKLKY